MFGETKLATPYFQQMTLHSKIPKIIHTSLHFGAECHLFWSELSIILEIWSGVSFVENRV